MKNMTVPQYFLETRKKLKKLSSKKLQNDLHRKFGKKINIYGVKTSSLNKIVTDYYKYFTKTTDLSEMFTLVDMLIRSRNFEETYIGIMLASKFISYCDMHAFWGMERWMDYMNCAFNTDLMCTKLLCPILKKYKHETRYLYHWASSTNKWRRRASAIILIDCIISGIDLSAGFVIAKKLCREKDIDVLDKFEELLLILAKADKKQMKIFLDEAERKIPEYIVEKINKKIKRK